MNLLTRIRKINLMLQNTRGTSVHFKEISEILSDVIDANVFIVSGTGEFLGYATAQQIRSERMNQILKDRQSPEEYVNSLSYIQETMANLDIESEYTAFPVENKELFSRGLTTIVPIVAGGKKLGTLILTRYDQEFDNDDLILAEYSATIVGLEIMHERSIKLEEEARSKAIVQMAIRSLSYSELEAVEHIFEELDGKEGLLVASKIADQVGITRSVIVNALRKLESAGVVDSRSLGMKGTYIRVLNDKFLFELDKEKSFS